MTRYALKVEGSIPGFNTNLSIELDPKKSAGLIGLIYGFNIKNIPMC
jgi:hypothetical protein